MTAPVMEILLRALMRWGAAVAFCIPLKHRPHFWLRACGMYLPLAALAWLLNPLEKSASLPELQRSLLVMYVAFFILLGLMVWICVEVNRNAALYCAVWSLLIGQTAYEGWRFLEKFCEMYGVPLRVTTLQGRIGQLLTGLAFYAAVCYTLGSKMPYKKEYHIGPRQQSSAFLIGILFMVQSAFLTSVSIRKYAPNVVPTSVMATFIIGQFYFLTLLYFQTELFKKSAMQKEMDALNLLYERQRQQYQVARQNVQIINKRCHELKVQIASLRKLAPADATVEQHIDEAERAVHLYDASCNTGNEVLDVVLTEKSLLCESRKIQFNAVADGSCLRFFEAGDLYALFANALDHAVESAVQVTQSDHRGIDLLVCVRQGFVVVNVISPARAPEQETNRTALYELKVMKRIVQKYKGTLTTEEQNGFFAVKIIFPCKAGK